MQPKKGNESDVERIYFRNGQLQLERTYLDGQPHGLARTWHKNGVLASEVPYQEGKLHGTCRHWNRSGKLLGSYVLDQGSGTQREWWDNGQLKLELSTLNGEFHGISRQWLMDGTLVSKFFFVQGTQVTQGEYQQTAEILSNLPKDEINESVQPESPSLTQKEHQLFIQSILERPNQAELNKWLLEAELLGKKRSLGNFMDENQALEFASELSSKGAASLVAADLYSTEEGDEFCDCLLIELPKNSDLLREVETLCNESLLKWNAESQPVLIEGVSRIALYWGC